MKYLPSPPVGNTPEFAAIWREFYRISDVWQEPPSVCDSACVTFDTYGAAGDGVTDDTEAVKKAMSTGKTVYFPAGEFVVGDLGLLTSSYCFVLDKGATLKPTASDTLLFRLGDGADICIDGGTFDGFYKVFNVEYADTPVTVYRLSVRNAAFINATFVGHLSSGANDATVNNFVFRDSVIDAVSCGFAFNCNVNNAIVSGNKVSNVVNTPEQADERGMSAYGFAVGYYLSEDSSNHTFVNNIFENLHDQGDGQCNGIRSISANLAVVGNVFRNLDSADATKQDCEGVYCYSRWSVIADNAFYNGGRNEGCIAAKGKRFDDNGNCVIANNVIEFSPDLTDHCSAIHVDCGNVTIANNVIRNAGRYSLSRQQFGVINTGKLKVHNGINILNNYIHCRGNVAIDLAHCGDVTVVDGNTIIVTSEMDPDKTSDRWGIQNTLLHRDDFGLDPPVYNSGDIIIRNNYFDVLVDEIAEYQGAYGRVDQYGDWTAEVDNIIFQNNVVHAQRDWYIRNYEAGGQQTLGNVYMAGNIYGDEVTVPCESVYQPVTGMVVKDFETRASVTYDPPNLNAGQSTSTTVTVPRLRDTDILTCSFSALTFGIEMTPYRSSGTTVYVQFYNRGATAKDMAEGTLTVMARRI